jgi:hypothetical protein
VTFRDRFFTPATARAIMSWRILLGVGVAVAVAVAGAPLAASIGVGLGVYAVSVLTAMPRREARPAIDPFAVGEPWRQLVQGAQSAERKLRSTIEGVGAGPLRDRMESIAAQLRHGLDDVWQVARSGDEIDATLRTLDPTALRSKLSTLEQRAAAEPSPETDAAVASVRSQLESADRLRTRRDETANSLRLTQTRLDELVARAAEVKVGAADTDTYGRDVDELVVGIEALRQAVEETRRA